MKRPLPGFWLAVAAGAIAGYLVDSLPWPARVWLALLLGPIPYAVAVQTRLIGDPAALPRVPIYVSSAVSLWVFALITLLMAGIADMDAGTLGFVAVQPAIVVAWATGITAAAMAILFVARALRIPESPIVRRLIPVTVAERTMFAGLSITAGICEEFVFRGFMMGSLTSMWGVPAVGLIVSSAVFGWMHAYQNAGGATRAGILGLILGVPVIVTGSIVPSMIAHAAIDIVAGLVLPRRLVDDLA